MRECNRFTPQRRKAAVCEVLCEEVRYRTGGAEIFDLPVSIGSHSHRVPSRVLLRRLGYIRNSLKTFCYLRTLPSHYLSQVQPEGSERKHETSRLRYFNRGRSDCVRVRDRVRYSRQTAANESRSFQSCWRLARYYHRSEVFRHDPFESSHRVLFCIYSDIMRRLMGARGVHELGCGGFQLW